MNDRDIIERVARILESPFWLEKHKRSLRRHPHWITQVTGAKAEEMMSAILPFMGLRRATRIKELLEIAGRKGVQQSLASKRRDELGLHWKHKAQKTVGIYPTRSCAELYPGQAYFHATNPNIKKTEENWTNKPVISGGLSYVFGHQ